MLKFSFIFHTQMVPSQVFVRVLYMSTDKIMFFLNNIKLLSSDVKLYKVILSSLNSCVRAFCRLHRIASAHMPFLQFLFLDFVSSSFDHKQATSQIRAYHSNHTHSVRVAEIVVLPIGHPHSAIPISSKNKQSNSPGQCWKNYSMFRLQI